MQMNKLKAIEMIILKERKEKLTGTSTKTAFSAMFQVTAIPE